MEKQYGMFCGGRFIPLPEPAWMEGIPEAVRPPLPAGQGWFTPEEITQREEAGTAAPVSPTFPAGENPWTPSSKNEELQERISRLESQIYTLLDRQKEATTVKAVAAAAKEALTNAGGTCSAAIATPPPVEGGATRPFGEF